ncbi:related to dienelactone hydrolase family protein [Cephalotrichum gorgonifer]|uniref:Related to dienelactone hydrolase family protein n=1 Tax=Cephalotrichum gorgonifer TaxID=2041049 RepID=A0AAE8MYI8_9PEZI|nr:related to dienelactone hydrolase family protein [Cephalotrichum gorgonifer]
MAILRFLWALYAAKSVLAATCDTSIIRHEGKTIGEEITYENLTIYVSEAKKSTTTAVLYLTDVFGIQLPENKLLADSFARAGYLTITPDLFAGEPAPADLNEPGWSLDDFLAANGEEVIDGRIATAVKYAKEELGIEKFGVTGYCFGGRYAFRAGGDALFAAHPSMLGDEDIAGAAGVPVSIAAAETDSLLSPERRAEIETLLRNSGSAYQLSLYSGTSHGFAVRANVSDPQQKFGKESAFLQAVRWFDTLL